MAGANNYKLILETQLDPKKVEAQIKALSGKNVFNIKAQFNQADISRFEQQLNSIKEKAKSVGKITLLGDTKGSLNKGIVEYTDQLGNAVKETILLNKNVKITQQYTQNLAKDEAGIVKLQEQSVKLTAKQADEMARAALNAEKFLAKSKNMDQRNPDVKSAIGTAQQIKTAVSAGDIENVRKLNDQLAIQKSALVGVKSGLDSWTAGLKNSLKQTIEYSLSIGLVYGALNQLKDAIQYVKELNKEMTNIQLVTGESPEQVAQLALDYNNLAKEMGATTLEVAKGSLEFIRQGKSVEDTAVLIKNSTMMSKLANMEAAEATDRLTSIMNGFKLEAEETGMVIDKLVKFARTYRNIWRMIVDSLKMTITVKPQFAWDRP